MGLSLDSVFGEEAKKGTLLAFSNTHRLAFSNTHRGKGFSLVFFLLEHLLTLGNKFLLFEGHRGIFQVE